MDFGTLLETINAMYRNDDPYKEYKKLQIKNWYYAFWDLYIVLEEEQKYPFLTFSFGVLLERECWEKTDTMHGIKLNRRMVAKKMVQQKNWRVDTNPLNYFQRYQFACWCCLEEEIFALFESFKQERKIKDGDTAALKGLVRFLSGRVGIDHIMEYWSNVVSGYASEMNIQSQHLYVCGFQILRPTYILRVEAVEFFWNKTKSVPEDQLSAEQKDEIFMLITLYASAKRNRQYPEVFEFCIRQIGPDKYPELLKRDFAQNNFYASLYILLDALCFDDFQRLFDCLKPSEITEDIYSCLLKSIKIEDYSGRYVDAAVKLFMHVWMKENFDSHRASILNKEMRVYPALLNNFIRINCVEPFWAMLDKASPDLFKEFMSSKLSDYIRSNIKERR